MGEEDLCINNNVASARAQGVAPNKSPGQNEPHNDATTAQAYWAKARERKKSAAAR